MTVTKILFFSLLISIFLAACHANETVAPSDPVSAEPEERSSPTVTALPIPTTTGEPAPTLTAEPKPTAPEIQPSPTTEKQAPSAPEPTPLVHQPGVENITITGAENLPVQTTLYSPGGSGPFPGVILLHMLGGDRQDWDDVGLTNALVENGFVALGVDLRGHGETGSTIDWQLAPEDLQRVWDHFTSLDLVDAQRTAVIGASIGGNLALITGTNQPAIQTVILLSPGLDYRGVTTEDSLLNYGSRPILIVASEEDVYAADSSRTLAALAQGESQLEMFNGAGHGTRMFSTQPELTQLILTWLAKNLK